MGKRVLITGASGFVGANLARRLLREGHAVHVLLRPNFSPWRLDEIRREVEVHLADLSDREELNAIVRSIRPEWVFHLAAHGAYPSQADLAEMLRTNVVGTVNLVEACLESGFEAFVNTGSSSEYGFKDHAPAEDEAIEPNSDYGVTKSFATLFCRYSARARAASISTLRLYSVYGPYEEPTRLVPRLILYGLRGELPPLVGPQVARDFVFSEDVCDAYLLAASRPARDAGAIYNVGTGKQTSLRDVVSLVRRILRVEAEPKWGSMPDRSWDTSTWVSNNAKAREQLGWRPEVDLEEGMRRTVQWFSAHPAMRTFYEDARTPSLPSP